MFARLETACGTEVVHGLFRIIETTENAVYHPRPDRFRQAMLAFVVVMPLAWAMGEVAVRLGL